jgi:hypothetical protein
VSGDVPRHRDAALPRLALERVGFASDDERHGRRHEGDDYDGEGQEDPRLEPAPEGNRAFSGMRRGGLGHHWAP